jgi:hypothetical protein
VSSQIIRGSTINAYLTTLCFSAPELPAYQKPDDGSSSDELEKGEKERRKDLQERDDFANRLRKKDKDKTRQILSKSERKVLKIRILFYKTKSKY